MLANPYNNNIFIHNFYQGWLPISMLVSWFHLFYSLTMIYLEVMTEIQW